MKIGDLVRVRGLYRAAPIGTIVSEFRHGVNQSFCEVLVAGSVVTVTRKSLEMIREGR